VLAPPPETASAPPPATPASEEPAAPTAPPRKLDTCGLKATLRDAGAKSTTARFRLTLTNTSSQPLKLVVPGDGSDGGWRNPALTWSATSGGNPVPPQPAPRCGMTNRIEPSEIITLAPGASREMGDWISAPHFAAGTYDVRLTYRNDPSNLGRTETATAETRKLISESTPCEVTSSPLRATLP
jgi:hypothetical protein